MTLNRGLNASASQLVTWKEEDTFALAPWVLVNVPVSCNGLQLVGLNMNPGRSIVTLTTFNASGMPSSTLGNGSLVIVNAAVVGSTLIVHARQPGPSRWSPRGCRGPPSPAPRPRCRTARPCTGR